MPAEPSTLPVSEPVRLAILGCGRIAQGMHLPILARTPGCRVTVLAEPSEAARAAASRLLPQAAALADWREAIARDDVDATVICLPTHLHAEPAALALEAGKSMFLEKPIAIDAEGSRRVVAAADAARGLVAMPAFNYRFHPVYRELRRRLLADDAGEIASVRTIFTVPPRALPAWKSDRRTGGGALLDQFSHHADLLRYLLDGVADARPTRVTADVRGVRSDRDTAVVQTQLASGVLVTSTLSMCTAEQDCIEVFGTRGKLVGDRLGGQVYFDPAGGGYSRVDRVERVLAGGVRAAKLVRFVANPAGETGHAAALAAFVEAVRSGGGASPVTMADGARSLAWVLAAERSAESGSATGLDLAAVGLEPDAPPPSDAGPSHPRAGEMPPIEFPPDDADPAERPLATVVLATSKVDASVRHVVAHVRRQTVASRVEFIAVAPSQAEAEALVKLDEGEVETLGSVRTLSLDRPVVNVDAEAAGGILQAKGPVTCVIEDHAFPAENWVEQLVNAYRDDASLGAAGSLVENANPRSTLSRMNLLVAYGAWLEPLNPGDSQPSNHNVSYRTDAVQAYGDTLADRVSRAGTIMADLQGRGFAVAVVRGARVFHTNPSRLWSSTKLRFDAGRLFGATKAEHGRWSHPKRAAYLALSPAITGLRFNLMRPKLKSTGAAGIPAVVYGLLLDALGQGVGFFFGSGNSARRLEAFELGRLRHLKERDRQDLTGRSLGFPHASPEANGHGKAGGA